MMRRTVGGESGQAMLEMAIALPVLAFILLGILDLGRVVFSQQVVTSAARDAARYASVGADDTTIGQVVVSDTSAIGTPTWTVQPDPRQSGNPVTVTVTDSIPIVDPLMMAVLGSSFQVHSSITMRVE